MYGPCGLSVVMSMDEGVGVREFVVLDADASSGMWLRVCWRHNLPTNGLELLLSPTHYSHDILPASIGPLIIECISLRKSYNVRFNQSPSTCCWQQCRGAINRESLG